MRCYVPITLCLAFICHVTMAQDNSRGEQKEEGSVPYITLPETDREVQKSAKLSRRRFKKTYLYWFYDHHEKLREDFYKRKKKLRKGYRRLARIMNKPQYRDHAYFGHKRKPKIRPVGKRKFCSECGIVH